MYVSEICAEGIFETFPWWLKNVKSRSKIAFFFKWAPFWNLISKRKTITFFWSKLSKLHKKDPILHVATTFFLKQRETRTIKPWTHSTPLTTEKNIAARSPSCTLQYRYVYTSLYVYFYRSTMEDTRLDDLMVLRCEKDLTDTIKLEDVLDEWSMKPRR